MQGDSPKADTLQRRKRKATNEAVLSLIDVGLPDFGVVGVDAVTTVECIEASTDCTAAEQAAAAERDAAGEAAVSSAIEEAAVGQAAAELADAEIEAAIEQAAAYVAAEHAEAISEAMEGMLASLEKVEADRLRLERRLTRQTGSDRGYVDAARSRSSARMEHACFICLDSHTDAYMPCCSHRVHRACIQRWHSMGQDKIKHQIKAPKQGGGWNPVSMTRVHKCPPCSSEMLSARVPRL